MSASDRQLIEDYLPIQAIGEAASSEPRTKGHISTLHVWRARRPLVACRAAVYGALVPASRFVPENGPDNKKQSLGRANAAKFVERLCKYPGNPAVISEAQKHIVEAHAECLTEELKLARSGSSRPAWVQEFKFEGEQVTVDDILAERVPRPRVLDMFAAAGAIPLEALRLRCEAYALELNPVAHLIELCTLVYPQKYGKPEPNARGMTGPKNEKGETTWGGLAEEVRYWGEWVLKKAKAEIGDLYPMIPDPEAPPVQIEADSQQRMDFAADTQGWLALAKDYLTAVAYLWTRTVTCKNPACRGTVPLVRQTWLCKKKDRYVALKMTPDKVQKCIRFEVTEGKTEEDLGFDPEAGSKGGNATCPFCDTVADNNYIKSEGRAGRIAQQMMAIVCTRPREQGKLYLSVDEMRDPSHDVRTIEGRIARLCLESGLTTPAEPMPKQGTLGFRVQPYGLKSWGDLFTARQTLCLLCLCSAVREAESKMRQIGVEEERAKSIITFLATAVDREAEDSSSLCRWNPNAEKMQGTFGRQALPMVWDFCEINPFGGSIGDWMSLIDLQVNAIEGALQFDGPPAIVRRGTATSLPWPDGVFDAVVTHPPYYDNVPYADLSDFFYVWLRRSLGHLYPDHFASALTPKKAEAVAEPTRHGDSKEEASRAYKIAMAKSFQEANRVLRPSGQMVVVYAHKTTLGWSTLVEALRGAGFTVTEAWPLDTEMKSRLRGIDSAALASSIFLVARKQDGGETGQYESAVKPGLEEIIRERVGTLWEMGISGADLVIACVGAGLRAFTRFARVEYANGEEVPAERFLAEVETVVLETILGRLSKEVGGASQTSLAGVDTPTRFYTLWRYTYRIGELDAGEAIVFANGTHVELDGPGGLSSGPRGPVEKKKGKYRLRDFSGRGQDEKLGLPTGDGQPVPIIDALQRTLWLMENRPAELTEFLREAQPNREQMRLVAQVLAGPALKGGELPDVSPSGELAALTKLLANWKSVVEDATISAQEAKDQKTSQMPMSFERGKGR